VKTLIKHTLINTTSKETKQIQSSFLKRAKFDNKEVDIKNTEQITGKENSMINIENNSRFYITKKNIVNQASYQ